jgi:uncharacterized protein with HEPN domain
MAKPAAKIQNAYLHDMLEAAELVHTYMANVSYDEFWDNSEKRDAVALRLAIIGEAARQVSSATERALPNVPFKALGGMRHRISHEYGHVDFKIVWAVTQSDIEPLIAALRAHLQDA